MNGNQMVNRRESHRDERAVAGPSGRHPRFSEIRERLGSAVTAFSELLCPRLEHPL